MPLILATREQFDAKVAESYKYIEYFGDEHSGLAYYYDDTDTCIGVCTWGEHKDCRYSIGYPGE